MPGYWRQGRGGRPRVQASRLRAGLLCLAGSGCWLLTACSDPLSTPVDLFHDLEGGQIAAQRPPPPGAGQPYPKLGTVPAKPTMPDPAYRRALQAQLAAERDLTERVAADTPIPVVPPPPKPATSGPATTGPAAANATLNTAEAPPTAARPAAAPPVPAPGAAQPVASPAPVDAGGPPASAPLVIVGASPTGLPTDMSIFPEIPPAPPQPATFEGVPAEPAPTPRIIPVRLIGTPAGTQLFFAQGDARLPPSQTQALKEFIATRKHQTVEIIGLGETASDTPDGQATAIGLALKRADAVAQALAALHVPQSAMRLGADAFGRGAVVRLLP